MGEDYPENQCIEGVMGDKIKPLLKYCGKDVKIYPFAKITNPEVVEIDDHSIISDFTFIDGGRGIKIGKHVHISQFTSVIGSGELIMGDFSGCAAGCRLMTGSDDYSGRSLTNPSIPIKYKPYMIRGKITIGKFAILGTNTIINPNVVLGEGSATMVNTYVTKDLKPWSIYGGSPARKIKERNRDMISLSENLISSEDRC